jgi:hypothetical protein
MLRNFEGGTGFFSIFSMDTGADTWSVGAGFWAEAIGATRRLAARKMGSFMG